MNSKIFDYSSNAPRVNNTFLNDNFTSARTSQPATLDSSKFKTAGNYSMIARPEYKAASALAEKQLYFGKNVQETNFRKILRSNIEFPTEVDPKSNYHYRKSSNSDAFKTTNDLFYGGTFKNPSARQLALANSLRKTEETESQFKNLCCKEYATAENANLFNRNYMEDTYRVVENFNNDPKEILFILFDGHGGSECSSFLKDKFPAALANFASLEASAAFSKTYSVLNSQLEKKNFLQVGSTATTALIKKNLGTGLRELTVANVGDSRAVLVKKSGLAVRLSYDHKGTDYKEAQRIRTAGGNIAFGRVDYQLALTRSFGDFIFKDSGVNAIPYISKTVLSDNDKLLIIASDGIWDVINDEELSRSIRIDDSSKEIAEMLVKTAMAKGSTDNISVIIVVLN